MLKSEKRLLGAHTYTVTQLGAVQGRGVLTRLLRLAGPALESGGDGGKAVAKLLSGITEDDMTYFCDVFAPQTVVRLPSGKEPRLADVFELHFAGNYGEMLQWLKFALEVNFGGFFGGMLVKLASKGDGSATSPDPNPSA